MEQQQQQLVNNNNRILLVNGDNPDSYAILKLDLEINGFIVDTFSLCDLVVGRKALPLLSIESPQYVPNWFSTEE
jgi:hypothetical protein